MKKFFLVLTVLGAIAFTYTACKHELPLPVDNGGSGGSGGSGGGVKPPDPVPSCSPDTVYFTNTILPILVSNCAMSGCHDAASHREGLNLTTYNGIKAIVRAGNAGSSTLIQVTSGSNPSMPPRGYSKLTAAQLAAITTWINQGAKNNSCTSGCDTSVFTYSGAVKPILANYCVGCHSGASAGGGIDLSTVAGVQAVAANGKLLGSIQQSSGYIAMPLGGGKLPDCQITQVREWINAGAKNN